MRIVGSASSTSSFIIAILSRPFNRAPTRPTPASNHPQRRGLPVVVPYSLPAARSASPASPKSSVGMGPLPTRVIYALYTPITCWILRGGRPAPVEALPATVEDEVTNG